MSDIGPMPAKPASTPTTVTVTNTLNGKQGSWTFSRRSDAAAFTLILCQEYDSSTFTIHVNETNPKETTQ